jgi:NADH-ubiquinone oxidoreductase chain 5
LLEGLFEENENHFNLQIIESLPTPVSSILHAATLVTAGIYLLIRSSPLLEYSPSSLICILFLGSLTCLFAASIGLLQNDLKRLIAYSTISQIGYLVIAVGLSQYNTALLHLAGHAYFKALLFLAAGGVLHSMADQQDMRRIGGLITLLPFTYTAILIGSFSLMAIFPLSGFYSKDLILELASATYTFTGLIAYTIGTITAGFTAFYSIRLILLTFTGRPHASQYLYAHTHDQPFIVQIPFIILILISIFYGYICKDVISGLGTDGLINSTYNLISTTYIIDAEFQSQTIKLIPSIVTVVSAGLALYIYQNPISFMSLIPGGGPKKGGPLSSSPLISGPSTLLISEEREEMGMRVEDPGLENKTGMSLYSFFNRKWLVDVVYGYIVRRGLILGAITSNLIDRGTLEILGPRGVSQSLYTSSIDIRRLDNGVVTTYASYMLISIVSLSFIILSI